MATSAKIACIGSGYWGRNLIRNFHELGELRWVCDSDPEKRAEVEALYPAVKLTESSDQVCADKQVCGVVIVTPAEPHGGLVWRVLLAGKDVFVEKPPCLSVRGTPPPVPHRCAQTERIS